MPPDRTTRAALLLAALLLPAALRAGILDNVDDALTLQAFDGRLHSRLSGILDLEEYYVDQPPPGLIMSGERTLFTPRLSLFLDTSFGSHLYSFVQVRVDRGFDPMNQALRIRADEYLIRYISDPGARFNLQVGKFATVIGNWVPRHDSWNNPFVTAPLPYENITVISDHEAPSSPDDFLSRKSDAAERYERLPIIWGPAYASGASVFGKLGKFSYAFAIKNAAPASRPDSWNAGDIGWSHSSGEGRIGCQPNEAWSFGFSASGGSYMRDEAAPTLLPGKGFGNYNEILLGQDIGYAWRHLQLWAEAFETRFQVPTVGNADTFAYYIEAKYKVTAQLFAALRWNQQLFNRVSNGEGGAQPWDNDIWRVDTALGCRFNEHWQAKLQYSFMHSTGTVPPVEQLFAVQLGLKF